jgi:hypothetical protein
MSCMLYLLVLILQQQLVNFYASALNVLRIHALSLSATSDQKLLQCTWHSKDDGSHLSITSYQLEEIFWEQRNFMKFDDRNRNEPLAQGSAHIRCQLYMGPPSLV